MSLDLFTVTVMTAVVVLVAGLTFIVETIVRSDAGAGRLWAVAFFSGLSATFAYLAWSSGVGGAVAVAIGNALFVGVPGFMWLGCRKFNDRPLAVPAVVIAVGAGATFVVSLLEAAALGSWGGWSTMAGSLTVLFVAGTVETLRSPMRRIRTSWALSAVLGIAGVFYLVRLVLFVTIGPDSDFFSRWFGPITANFVTVVLTMVAAIATSVLRSHRTDLQRYEWLTENGVAADGVMLPRTFAGAAGDIVERASWRSEGVALFVIRIEGLAQIRASFGVEVADEVVAACRLAARRYAPAAALVGEDADDQLIVCALAATAIDARRMGAAIYRGCVDELSTTARGLFPFVGVGVAVTDAAGYDLARLQAVAYAAALRAAASAEASVLVGAADPAPDLSSPSS
ncbi:diguanylate cyclase [Microbacterium sp.]|uniref:diguanylate cyclase n=1 Tax=Microbacterium sp. TaxID=51671 RepID=UPI0039E52FF7